MTKHRKCKPRFNIITFKSQTINVNNRIRKPHYMTSPFAQNKVSINHDIMLFVYGL